MAFKRDSTLTPSRWSRLQQLLTVDPAHPHIHLVDMPFRICATWQDYNCDIGVWEVDGAVVAWAVFQPPWWNVDYAVAPAIRGTPLEKAVFAWGKQQMLDYAQQTGEQFWGSIELFEDVPQQAQTVDHLTSLGFQPFSWSTVRLALDTAQPLPDPTLPDGFSIRPMRGAAEVGVYVELQRATFGSQKMTHAWRTRTLAHPDYRPNLDLFVVNAQDKPVGFCLGWLQHGIGQIEPLGVHPDYQGLGLGRALERTAIQNFRQQGAQTVYIDHVSLNTAAISLSQQIGFTQLNNARRFYIDTNDAG